jgi:hypothetical protein
VYAHARRLRHKPGNIAEDAIVFMAMDPVPNIDDRIARAYQGAFVESWNDFVKGWRSFVDDRRHSYDHMSNGSYGAAIDYRREANPWRPKFVALGGAPSTPEAALPEARALPCNSLLFVDGVVAAALVLPAAFRAFGR